MTDYTYVDGARNLLAYRYFGKGPTILLSEHMDTVEDFEVGRSLIERGLTDMPDWKITAGGQSDERSFAEKGIPSVNLSTGYMHEHTDEEIVDYKATFETVKLIETALHERLMVGHGDRFVVPVV
ncbi:hypothetical protein [Aquibacillus sediminis]|uniref:hypothetical protein n=1 Tax=Aquibacillus sediminis TaxID=2574734 RepID=UPI0011089378|nr:hypothetical protein [Aquibacillus sediminis]